MRAALETLASFLAGYAVGSVPLGLLIGRAVAGIDIRRHGTGGIGASNVRHNLGIFWAAVVMVGLFLQGLLPPLAISLWGGPEAAVVAAALGTVMGYSWSMFLGKVEGARGVGVSAGAAAVLSPSGLILLYLACALGTLLRQGSIGVLLGFVLYAGWVFYFADSAAYRVGAFALLALVLVRRLEGVREDLRRAPLRMVLLDRLVFDHRPDQRLVGPERRSP